MHEAVVRSARPSAGPDGDRRRRRRISPDLPDKQLAFDTKYELGFPLLSDPDHSTIEAWGAWGEKVRGGRTSIGLIRSSFLVDEDGRIEGVVAGQARGHGSERARGTRVSSGSVRS